MKEDDARIRKRMRNWRWGWWGLFLFWATVSMACNLPLGLGVDNRLERPSVPVVEDNSAETPNSPAIILQAPETTVTAPPPTIVRTAEPLNFAPTVTPRAEPNTTIIVPTATIIPLTLEHKISWRLNNNDPEFSFATVQLSAAGGEPPYIFYRDNVPTGGPSFSYRWGSCVLNPGKFRVDSADGQSIQIEYSEQTPCRSG